MRHVIRFAARPLGPFWSALGIRTQRWTTQRTQIEMAVPGIVLNQLSRGRAPVRPEPPKSGEGRLVPTAQLPGAMSLKLNFSLRSERWALGPLDELQGAESLAIRAKIALQGQWVTSTREIK
jgi:hypothetical protein